jgi:hypothetical protein
VSARILSASARLGFNRNTLRKKLLEHGLEDGDDAVGSRPRRLSPATPPDPVGRLVSGQHVADADDAAVGVADHGQSLEREVTPSSGLMQ